MLSEVKSWGVHKCTRMNLPLCPIYYQLPLWLLHRHNTYLQECTGQREPTYQLNIHDTKLLFLRFATEQSFSVDTGGGGRESNIHLIPYIIHTVLYVLNTYVPGWCVYCQYNMQDEPTDYNLWQYKGDIPWRKEPAEFPGAALWEMGGELLWCWRPPLLYHLCHAHHAAWTLEDFTVVLPA